MSNEASSVLPPPLACYRLPRQLVTAPTSPRARSRSEPLPRGEAANSCPPRIPVRWIHGHGASTAFAYPLVKFPSNLSK